MRSLLYLTGRTPSPFPSEPEQDVLPEARHRGAAGAGATFIGRAWDARRYNDRARLPHRWGVSRIPPEEHPSCCQGSRPRWGVTHTLARSADRAHQRGFYRVLHAPECRWRRPSPVPKQRAWLLLEAEEMVRSTPFVYYRLKSRLLPLTSNSRCSGSTACSDL